MMLEKQVCSLEYARKLLTLGVNQNSNFYWFESPVTNIWVIGNPSKDWENYSAFTVAELFELLPAFIDTKQNEPFNNFWLQINKRTAENIQYIARYVCDSMPGEEIGNPHYQLLSQFKSHSPKLADCLAEMLIQLLEAGLIND